MNAACWSGVPRSKETEVPSGTIPAHKPVFLMKAAANRDPRAFDDGETFDITRDRTQAQNLGLGYGIHSCLGAALARLETVVAFGLTISSMRGLVPASHGNGAARGGAADARGVVRVMVEAADEDTARQLAVRVAESVSAQR